MEIFDDTVLHTDNIPSTAFSQKGTNKSYFWNNTNTAVHIINSINIDVGILSFMHFHETIEILHVTKGAIRCLFADNEIILHSGDIIFINSNVPHQTFCIADGTNAALYQFHNPTVFNHHLYYLNEFFSTASTPSYVFNSNDEDYNELCECLVKMLKINEEKLISSGYYMISCVYILLAIFNRKKFLISDNSLFDAKLIKKIMPIFEFIDQNYAEHLTLEDMAKAVNFHKEYFCRLFKQATGSTVIDYLNFVRVHKAEELLKENKNITDVAYRVGFASSSYFTKIFKRYRLCSPSTYQQIYKNPEKMFYDTKITD